ncbi:MULTISPECIES: AraC family transcriptional regulator [unclassified Bradyrhizobium]|uniref:AraC family transcriptional regulator n=1 Tax=unclassified Bradyrhizobium TaxID=2631580 RepID=UPI0023066CDE|nr:MULTISPECIES: AraC family transcriptional regulator [unclassified Bradyrhizobium]MDA9407264.1 AraC family transcriptional regulator [Bradyrhizobium sp. CCBAU 45384]MDA9439849.1 AraC family transcriptional regulator [Bradyrhizobium sp. CCBAU 51745]
MPFQAVTATPRRAMTPAAFVRGVAAAYARYGRDPTEALAKGQVQPDLVGSADGRITAVQFEALAGHAMRELDDEALGWFSRRLPWGSYGMLCRASITAPNLEVALKRWCRHHRLLTEDVLFELEVSGETATISLREQRDLADCREFCLVTLLRYVLGFSCWAVDSAIALRAAEFPYTEPAHVSVYPTIFCKHIRFDAETARIIFDKHYLSLPLTRSPADLDSMLKGALRLTVLPYRRDRLLVERVRRVLREARGRILGAEDVASELALSTRTMHRRLREEATSLRDLKEEAKLELAKQELMRGRNPIKRIAEIAGFRNEKSFSRAFRSWTGASPREFRDRYR